MTNLTYYLYKKFLSTLKPEEVKVLHEQHRGEFNRLFAAATERATEHAEENAELMPTYAGAF